MICCSLLYFLFHALRICNLSEGRIEAGFCWLGDTTWDRCWHDKLTLARLIKLGKLYGVDASSRI